MLTRRLLQSLLPLLLAACGPSGWDPPPLWGDHPVEPLDLRAQPSATEVALLEPLTVTVDLYLGRGTEADFQPLLPEGFAGTVDALAPRLLAQGTARRWLLQLKPTRVGPLRLPPFKVEARGGQVATSKEATITVKTVLAGHAEDVEAPAPPFPARVDPWPWILGGAAAAAAIALVWWWVRRPVRRPQVVETPLPPHVKALRALARLRQSKRATPEQVEAFYVEVSQVLRVYLEERFHLHAPERTTDEFLCEVQQGGRLEPVHQGPLGEFLRQCDLVKFARALPGEDVHAGTFAIAERFVDETRADRVREGAA